MDANPLRWALAHPIIVDNHGGGYHRVWCDRIDDNDGTTGTRYWGGELPPRDRELRACLRCQPELALVEA